MSFYLQNHKLYEGKAKILFKSDRDDVIVQYFKNSLTAFDAKKRAEIAGKGAINNAVTNHLMGLLNSFAINTHQLERIDDCASYVRSAVVIPVETTVRNYCAGRSFIARTYLQPGDKLPFPLCEFMLKDDRLGDPLIGEDQIVKFGLASRKHLVCIKRTAMRINDIVSSYLLARGLILADMKLEFGVSKADGSLMLVDEISPDTCRLWDVDSRSSMDKDVFRFQTDDPDVILSAYRGAMYKICGQQ